MRRKRFCFSIVMTSFHMCHSTVPYLATIKCYLQPFSSFCLHLTFKSNTNQIFNHAKKDINKKISMTDCLQSLFIDKTSISVQEIVFLVKEKTCAQVPIK